MKLWRALIHVYVAPQIRRQVKYLTRCTLFSLIPVKRCRRSLASESVTSDPQIWGRTKAREGKLSAYIPILPGSAVTNISIQAPTFNNEYGEACRGAQSWGTKDAQNWDAFGVEKAWEMEVVLLSPADLKSGSPSGIRGGVPAAKAFRWIFSCEIAYESSNVYHFSVEEKW